MRLAPVAAACDVVIPVRNARRYIGAAIDSVLTQSRPAAHLIIVDDRSTDGTGEAAAAFGDAVRVVRGDGAGAGAARNRGVRESTSEFVAFLDADDVCRSERLERQVAALVEHPDAAMAFCDAEFIDAGGRPVGAAFTCPDFQREAFLGQLFERNRVLTASVAVVRRAAFDAAGGFDERFSHAEDYDLWLRLAGAGRVEHVPQVLVAYRLHGDNLSSDREALGLCERDILRKHASQDIRSALAAVHGSGSPADVALSRVLFRMEQYAEGEASLRGANPEDTDTPLGHFMLGNFGVKRGDAEAAAAEYARCVACDPAFAPAHNNLGVIAAAEGRRAEASAHFVTAAGLRPQYSDPRRNLEALRAERATELRYTFAPLREVLRPE